MLTLTSPVATRPNRCGQWCKVVYDFKSTCCQFATPPTRMDARCLFTTLIARNNWCKTSIDLFFHIHENTFATILDDIKHMLKVIRLAIERIGHILTDLVAAILREVVKFV